ncbi:MAG: DUF4365 domain-containing protein [Thalassospira sp.]|uniref:DUF4365 domain-containing protein n=1 Tax=Thalassospira sp. TaxID=1912094 RepID=UPI0032ED8770
MKFTSNNITDQTGIHFFAYSITKHFRHICRLNTGLDVGIDAEIEIVDQGDATGQYFRVQIKSTSDDVSSGKTYYIGEDHTAYWQRNMCPVIFCVVDVVRDKIYSKLISNESLRKTSTQYALDFSASDILDVSLAGKLFNPKLPSISDPVRVSFIEILGRIERLHINGFDVYGDVETVNEDEAVVNEVTAELVQLKKMCQRKGGVHNELGSKIDQTLQWIRSQVRSKIHDFDISQYY